MSLLVLYALATVILLKIYVRKSRSKTLASIKSKAVFISTLILIALYMLQLMTSFFAPFMESLSHAMYMSIPLLYIVVVQKFCPQFDLAALGKAFLILMVPVNIIGFVQYFINPDFFISSVYSGDLGGVILRNFFDGGYFSRYPSLFTSADRYSAMGLMQLYFTIVVFKASYSVSRMGKLWLVFNLISAFSALFISGARSRILIASLAGVFMVFTFVLGYIFSPQYRRARKAVHKLIPLLAGTIIIFITVFWNMPMQDKEQDQFFPVVELLLKSFERGDISQRVDEASDLSLVSDETTFFGQGLGSIGNGKPGEFGIKSMWIESGFFWGVLMLMAFTGMIAAITIKAWKSFVVMDALSVIIYVIPILLLMFGLLAGLTSTFELSTGLLLGCSIAVITRSSANITGGYQLPLSNRKKGF
ncbi:MAG: hypothetical protein HOL31_07820 [Candidatus Scalindua sp.]|nr:hypothetical protein [Candidatus Scalindua sp.]